jgi:hypothetical protein
VTGAGPTVAEERALALRARGLPVADVPWRTYGVVWPIVFFGLTTLALAATFWLLDKFGLPKGFVTGALALSVAEALIRRYRFFGTGVESALWIGGLFAIILGLRGEGRPEALLLFAAASAIGGYRVRNPLFGGAAAAFVVVYLDARYAHELAAALGLAVSVVALLIITRELQRPSTEWLWYALLVITPIAGGATTLANLHPAWAVAYLATATACAAIGIRSRLHAPLVAAAVHTAIAAVTLVKHDVFPWRTEWRMIAGGTVLLALTALISRALRGRRTGVVVTPEMLTPFDEAVQIATTIGVQAQPAPEGIEASAPERGGEFGGAGASGHF